MVATNALGPDEPFSIGKHAIGVKDKKPLFPVGSF